MARLGLWWQVLSAALHSRSNQQFYDCISPIYDQVFVEHKFHAQNMTNMLAIYNGYESSVKVLDLGCGTGILSHLLADKGFDVIGLDISSKSLQMLQQRDPKIFVIHGDAALLPLTSSSCQVVVSLGAWRHFSDPKKVIKDVARVLAKDGLLIVGYFPPALGGVIHQGQGIWRRLLVRLYQWVIRKLGYVDRTDLSLEQQTVSLARKYFTKVNWVESGEHWHLIVAKEPKLATCKLATC